MSELVEVELRLPGDVLASYQRLAELAGVPVEHVIQITLAAVYAKAQEPRVEAD